MMSPLEHFLRWYTGRQVVDPAKLADLEREYDAEREREVREARAEQVRVERERRQAAAEATCRAEGHIEPDDDGEQITMWGQRGPIRTIRWCERCGANLVDTEPEEAAGLYQWALAGDGIWVATR